MRRFSKRDWWILAVVGLLLLLIVFTPSSVLEVLGLKEPPIQRYISHAVQTGQPIIHALEQYKNDNGAYPDSLQQLVPKYLKRIPATGVPSRISLLKYDRSFYYMKKGSKGPRRQLILAAARGDAPYAIVVPLVPSGTLIYRPTGDYSDLHSVRMHGKWAHTNQD